MDERLQRIIKFLRSGRTMEQITQKLDCSVKEADDLLRSLPAGYVVTRWRARETSFYEIRRAPAASTWTQKRRTK